MKFSPHFIPKDSIDFIAFVLVGSAQVTVLLLVPYFLTLLITKSALVAFIPPVLIYACFALFSVRSVFLDEAGIKFSRTLGTPKFLRWDEIQEVTPVSRSELILHGWLWPLLPAREMTPTLSSTGHFRISWAKGYCYYPPADAELFKSTVNEHLTARILKS